MKYSIGDRFKDDYVIDRYVEIEAVDSATRSYVGKLYKNFGSLVGRVVEGDTDLDLGYTKIHKFPWENIMKYVKDQKFIKLQPKDSIDRKSFFKVIKQNPSGEYELLLYNEKGEPQVYLEKSQIFMDWELMELNHFPWELPEGFLKSTGKKECTCIHSFFHSQKGCTCGAIIPYKTINPFEIGE